MDGKASGDEIGGTGRKEGESEREAAEIHARRGIEIEPGSRKWGNRWRKPDARKGKETEGNTWATRAGRPVEELVSNRGRRMSRGRKQKRRRQKRERSLKSRKMTKEEHEVP